MYLLVSKNLNSEMKKYLAASAIAVSAVLSGCAADILLYQAFKVVDDVTSTQYRVGTKDGLDLNDELDYAWAIPVKMREITRSTNNCAFKGAVVPWERTWEIVESHDSQTKVTPPAPGVIAGHVILTYQMTCPGKQPEDMFDSGEISVGRAILGRGFDGHRFIPGGNNSSSFDMLELAPEKRPQWLPQVVDRLVRIAPTNKDAALIVRESRSSLVKLYPEKAAAIDKAISTF